MFFKHESIKKISQVTSKKRVTSLEQHCYNIWNWTWYKVHVCYRNLTPRIRLLFVVGNIFLHMNVKVKRLKYVLGRNDIVVIYYYADGMLMYVWSLAPLSRLDFLPKDCKYLHVHLFKNLFLNATDVLIYVFLCFNYIIK